MAPRHRLVVPMGPWRQLQRQLLVAMVAGVRQARVAQGADGAEGDGPGVEMPHGRNGQTMRWVWDQMIKWLLFGEEKPWEKPVESLVLRSWT